MARGAIKRWPGHVITETRVRRGVGATRALANVHQSDLTLFRTGGLVPSSKPNRLRKQALTISGVVLLLAATVILVQAFRWVTYSSTSSGTPIGLKHPKQWVVTTVPDRSVL